MNETDALLSQLRDVHAPSVSWIPAPGWWLLAFFAGLLLLLYVLLRRRYQQRGWQREARAELNRLRAQVHEVPANETLSAVSRLVRRVALKVRPREQIASLHGKDWLAELDSICGREVFNNGFGQLLETGPYQATPSIRHEDLHALMEQVDELINASTKARASGGSRVGNDGAAA